MVVDSFGQDMQCFGWVLQGMLEGDKLLGVIWVCDFVVQEFLNEIFDLFVGVNESVDEILESLLELFQVWVVVNGIFKDF